MDIEDVTQVYQEINNIDHVYHCAANSQLSLKKQGLKCRI